MWIKPGLTSGIYQLVYVRWLSMIFCWLENDLRAKFAFISILRCFIFRNAYHTRCSWTPRTTVLTFSVPLWVHIVYLSLSFRVWQHSHCDYLRPLFEIRDLAVSIPPEKRFRAWIVALSQYWELKDCEIERGRKRVRGGDERRTPLHSIRAVPVSLPWPSSLSGDRSLHIVRCLHPLQLPFQKYHPSLVIWEIQLASAPLLSTKNARPRWRSVHGWMLSEKTSSSITLWWAVGWSTNWPWK